MAGQVTEAVIKDYDFTQEIDAPIEERIGIETQKPDHDIILLEQMNQLIDDFYKNAVIDVAKVKAWHVNLKDSRLKFIDRLLVNPIINRLLSYKGYPPSMRKLLMLLRF